jgi:hypothetical protein
VPTGARTLRRVTTSSDEGSEAEAEVEVDGGWRRRKRRE